MMEGEQAYFLYDKLSMEKAFKHIDAMAAKMGGNNL